MPRSRHLSPEASVALALAGLVLAGVILGQDWRVAAGAGGLFLVLLLVRFPFFGLLLTVTILFVGTPSLKITHAPGVVSQYFPAMLLLPPTLLGFLAAGARRRPHVPVPVRREDVTPLAPFVVAIVALHLCGLAWAPHTAFAWGHVATLVFNTLLFFTLLAATRDPARLRALYWAMVVAAVLMCATMVCGALYNWAGTIHLASGVELNFELFSEKRWGRIGGLCSANQAGGFLVFATFLAFGLFRLSRRPGRVVLALLALTFLVFVVVSGSRGAILGFLGACGLFMLFHAPTRRRIVSRATLVVLVLLVAILIGKPSFIDRMLVGFGYSGPLLFSEKKTSSDSASNVSGSGARFRMWKQALSVMADRPELMLLGLGPGGFIWYTGEPEVHSLWLAFFFDMGLAGGLTGLLGLAVLCMAVKSALRRAPPGPARTLFVTAVIAALGEIGIHSLIDHDLTSSVSRFAWLYVAVVAAALQIVRHCPQTVSEMTPEVAHDTAIPVVPYGPVPVFLPGAAALGPAPEPGPALAATPRPAGPGDGRA